MNEFVRFYEENEISPVSQDISNLKLHIKRRERLYRLLGIDSQLFKGANILEVGAGSGYNTLVFLLLGAKVDIVEPNPTGRKEMQNLFSSYHINPSQYQIYDCVIEAFDSSMQYDFVIAEGFLPPFEERQRDVMLEKLFKNVKDGGYCVITTICEFSYFFEYLRRILGLILVKDIGVFEEKVKVLSQAFKGHLETLKFASRPIEDWVKDSILNPVNDHFSFTIADSIRQFQKICAFDVVGTSPALVANLSWYKDIEYSYARQILRDFSSKRHLLVCTQFEDSVRDVEKNDSLACQLRNLKELIKVYREGYKSNQIVKITHLLEEIIRENQDLGEFFLKSVKEVILLLKGEGMSGEKISCMKHFSKAWGRGQQYVCIKKIENEI